MIPLLASTNPETRVALRSAIGHQKYATQPPRPPIESLIPLQTEKMIESIKRILTGFVGKAVCQTTANILH